MGKDYISVNKKINRSHHNFDDLLLMNILTELPAHGGTGKIFDFNATLPAMAIQFLLLMIFLDKNWFGPIGKVIDDRNDKIRTSLKSAKAGGEQLAELEKEAEKLLKDARIEAKAMIAEAKDKSKATAESEIAKQKTK